ncbi:hypothetical protein AWZ03_010899 [Drosophila navojoa]|uniref:Uncharacterized protein n=1 Tax=Drosophila navojoa TaxID=7232 RepID=A0A484B241_DRONA|nr:uncharacterized protein LOC108658788 [Drosophila navojoa]TDG42679.1 hypothetical protein AWZ03_010899 [Drosophila navojoa]
MGDFDLNVDSLIQRLLENFKKQKEAEEHAQKLLIAQQLAAAGGGSGSGSGSGVSASSSAACLVGAGSSSSSCSGATAVSAAAMTANDPLDELTEQQRRMLQQYSISPPSETMISADGDQITVHHPREEPKKSRLKLRDFFVAEFGIL